MSKWIAEFELEDGDAMPEHMDLEYKGGKIDFHCKPLKQEPCEDCISRRKAIETKCDRINSLASVLPYTAHREIQELLCEIMDLRKEGENKK